MSFQYDYKGRPIFYPWGIHKKGYILPDEATKNRISRYIKYFEMAGLSIALAGSLVSFVLAILFFPLFVISYHFIISRLVKDFPVSDLELTYYDNLKQSAKEQSKGFLLLIMFLSITMVIASVGSIIINRAEPFWGLMGIVVFGFSTFGCYLMIKIKDDNRS